MHLLLSVAWSLGAIIGNLWALEKEPFSPAEVHFFSKKEPTFFYSDHLTGARYYKFLPNGNYVVIAKEHLGVWPKDYGTWSQANDGVVTLASPNRCADVIAGPLSIQVVRQSNLELLPELLSKINKLLESLGGEKVPREELEALKAGETVEEEAKFPIGIRAEGKESFLRGDVVALSRAIEEFLENPDLQKIQAVPLAYRENVFLNSLNQVTNRNYLDVCKAINRNEGPKSKYVYHPFMIDKADFFEGTGTAYPFKYFSELNGVSRKND